MTPVKAREFRIRDRVQLSAEGRNLYRKTPDRAGVVIGYSAKYTLVRVLWDGFKYRAVLHPTFLTSESLDDKTARKFADVEVTND